jgi:hypothetical protein
MVFLASIVLINPGDTWIANNNHIPQILRNNVSIGNIRLDPPMNLPSLIGNVTVFDIPEIR